MEEEIQSIMNAVIFSSPATGKHPSMQEYPGNYNFEMELVDHETSSKRSPSWKYSVPLKKLFLKAGCKLPIKFRVTPGHPDGLYVRAVAVFCDAEAVTLPVLRCPNHIQSTSDPINSGYLFLDHVVSSNHSSAVYEVDPQSQRRSVCVVLSGPPPGSEWETVMFAMMCLNSCSNGINRRPLALIFTLEIQQEVVGRLVLPVRVCAAPKRDCTAEESKAATDHKEKPLEADEDTEDLGPLDRLYSIPVVHHEDYITLAKEAKELVERDYPDDPQKEAEILRYDQILFEHD